MKIEKIRRRSLITLVLLVFALSGFALGGCATTSSGTSSTEAEMVRLEGRSLTDSREVSLLDSPTLGDPDAPIVIVEFLSFPCPDCGVPTAAIETLMAEGEGEIQLVFKHQPRDDRPESWIAARALEAAREMGAFWEMRALLMDRMAELTPGGARALVFELAAELELEERRFRRAFESLENTGRIERDQKMARALELGATPTYFVNGAILVGPRRLRHFQDQIAGVKALQEELAEEGILSGEFYAKTVEVFRAEHRENRIPEEDELEVADVDTSRLAVFISDQDLIYGEKEDFLVTIVEFSSLQCPYGADASETMEALARHYDEKIRFVFKHFPQDHHPESEDGAAAVVAAARQGAGVEMLRAIYARQNRLGQEGFLEDLALLYELNPEQFRAVYNDRGVRDRIWDDREEGLALGVVSTPEFFVNGVRISGAHPFEHFQRIIDAEISRAREVQAEHRLSGDELYRLLLQREVEGGAGSEEAFSEVQEEVMESEE